MSNVMPATNQPIAMPSAMERKLRVVRRRLVALATARALVIGSSVLIAGMVAAMTVDWMWGLFDPILRTILTLTVIASAIAAVASAAITPLRRGLRRSHIARLVDSAVPALQQRWTTVANFARPHAARTSAAPTSMLAQVTSEAVALESLVDPRQIVSRATAGPACLAMAACALGLLGFLSLNWNQTSILLQRFWSPTQNITATKLVSDTGDRMVPRGEVVELITSLTGLARASAELTLEFASGAVDVIAMDLDHQPNNRFVYAMRVNDSLRYRVRAGDGQTAWHSLQIIDYPEIAELRMTVRAPEYLDAPVITKEHIPRRLKVVEGTRLSLAIKPREPVERLVIQAEIPQQELATGNAAAIDTEIFPDADGWYHYQSLLLGDVTIYPRLWSPYGLTNETTPYCKIQVVADKAPLARLVHAAEEAVAAPDDVLDIEFEAHDDHGIATAELIVYDETNVDENGQPVVVAVQPIALGEQHLRKHVAAKVRLDLAELGLPAGANISYAIRVTDNRDASGDAATQADGLLAETTAAVASAPTEPDSVIARAPDSHAASESGHAEPAAVQSAMDKPNREDVASGSLSGGQTNDATTANESAVGAADPSEGEPIGSDSANPSLANNPPAVAANHTDRANTQASAVAQDIVAETELDPDREGDQQNEIMRKPDRPDPAAVAFDQVWRSRTASPDTPDRGDIVQPSKQEVTPDAASQMGQGAETNRRRLKIVERLVTVAAGDGQPSETTTIRDRVANIDKMLAMSESGLKGLVAHEIPDAQRGEQFQRLDDQLGEVENYVAKLRHETQDGEFAFVGLQMVDISRTHVAAARERVFAGTRAPNGSDVDAKIALGRVERARQRLDELLRRYDQVAQERELEKSLEEAVTIYEVYVEKRQQLMREARQNRNPLVRKMEILELDQEYLDRYAEVLKLRGEMMEEFGRLLGDDPRLLSRYLDLVKRRQRSLYDQLHELALRQDEAAVELRAWLEIDEDQKQDLWNIIAEARLYVAKELAKDTSELAERIEKQMPLQADLRSGAAAEVLRYAQQITEATTLVSLDMDQLLQHETGRDSRSAMLQRADELLGLFDRLDASLDRLQFEHENEVEFTNYIQARAVEGRAVADQAAAWSSLAADLVARSYPSMVAIEHHRLAVATETLRVDMLGIEVDLEGQFQRQAEVSVPGHIIELVQELHGVMEAITFNQVAVSSAAHRTDLQRAARQQQLAVERFARAEELFNKLRREVADALDAYPAQRRNIADLRDPTLDAFLAQLEREPNITAQLGIPNRPRNLRQTADAMLWQQTGGELLGSSGEAAAQRAKLAMQMTQSGSGPSGEKEHEDKARDGQELSEAERQKMDEAKELQKMLERALLAVEEQSRDPGTSPEQREQFKQLAESMRQVMQESDESPSGSALWQQIAESELATRILAAAARGERIPDQQWNKLLSTLNDGLWQVVGRKPPEAYRQAIQQYQDQIQQLTANASDLE